jgi:hypothetical protein
MQRKGAKLNVNFNNIKEAEAPGGNYVVEFNNQKEVLVKQTTEVKETHVEEKKDEVVEPPAEVEVHEKEEITTPPEDLNNLLANAQTTEPVNIESTGNEFNYDEYQTNGYEQIDQNYTGLQSTEVVNETEIRNSIQEAVIRQSLNKPLYQENTLPVIRQEKVNKVIYETNATYLPVIYGGKKVTYLSENESKNFDFSTLQNATEIQGDEYTNINKEFQTGEVKYNEPIQIEGVNYSEGFQTGGVNYNETYETTGQDYTNFGQNNYTTTETTGDYNNLFGNTETTTTTTTTTQTFMGNTQNVDYGQINPIEQSIGFGEYQKTNY